LPSCCRPPLTFEGYQVGVAGTGAEALEQVRTVPGPHLVMLDVNVARLRRQRGLPPPAQHQGEQMPIVFLHRPRTRTEDKVEGLSMGDTTSPSPSD